MLPANIHFIQRGWLNSNYILITGEAGAVLVDTGHCHWDHYGGNEVIQAMSGATVIMSEKTADRFPWRSK